MATAAQVLVDTLYVSGIRRIYGIVGDSLNGITNAMQKRPDMKWIHTRHEEAAAFAAGAESQLTGELSVCAGSCGPGNTHLINGLYDCQRSGAPVLAIAAHIPSPEVGGQYFQETDPKAIFRECSVFCEIVQSAEQLPRLLEIAMQAAVSLRGVAVLVISGDVAMQKATHPSPKTMPLQSHKPSVLPKQKDLEAMADLLNDAKKVTLFCGIGCAGYHDEVVELAKCLNAPVVHTLRGKPYVEYDNPYDVGMTGLIGFSSGYYAMESCDVLVLLGTSFPYRQFYPEKAKIIQIDLHGQQLGKRCSLDLGLVGDVGDTLKALLPLLTKKDDASHLEKARAHYLKARKSLDDLAKPEAPNKPLHPQFLTRVLDKQANADALFTCDVGTPTVWAARYLTMNGKRKILGSFNHGSMANALSQAIGLQVAYPNRQVVAMCGDGGFAMLMGDLLTIRQYQLPVKLIIFNNGTLGFVEMEMHVGGMLEYGTSLDNPDFAAMANAIGIMGIRVNSSDELDAAMDKFLAHKGPALLDVRINRAELVMPPVVEYEHVKGFSLYMMKAIIDGRGTEVMEVLKNQLWK